MKKAFFTLILFVICAFCLISCEVIDEQPSEPHPDDNFFVDDDGYDNNDVSSGDESQSVPFAGGTGRINDPYRIATAEQFNYIASYLSKNTYFKLTDSIDLRAWNTPFMFTGHLDGNGQRITYYQTISAPEGKVVYGGLFSSVEQATVSNLIIEAYVSVATSSTAAIGCLAGISRDSQILQVNTKGAINYDFGDHNVNIGGVVGEIHSGSIEQCCNEANIQCHARHAKTGGIAGFAGVDGLPINISDSYNKGEIAAYTPHLDGGRASGGIVGQICGHAAINCTISNCYNIGVVKIVQEGWLICLGWYGCGDIIGDIFEKDDRNIIVQNCYWPINKNELCGNNGKFHQNGGIGNMNGIYPGWSSSIWAFSSTSSPALKWML